MADRCIYYDCSDQSVRPCSQEFSKEHFLPKHLGRFRGMECLLDRVCKECNNRIGRETEEQFLRTGPIAYYRALLDIQLKTGDHTDLFYRGSHGSRQMIISGPPIGETEDIYWEMHPGTKKVFPATQLLLLRPDGERVPLILSKRMQDPAYVLPLLDELGLKGLPVESFYCQEAERNWVESVARLVDPRFVSKWTKPEHEAQERQMTVSTRFTNRFHRAIAKVAFHYTLKMFPDLRGDEPEFQPTRSFIMNGGDESRFVTWRDETFIGELKAGKMPTQWMHVLAAERRGSGSSIIGRCAFFGGRQSMPLEFDVTIGRDPSGVARPWPQLSVHQFIYKPELKAVGYDGEMEAARPVEVRMR